jgi:hypothetical protein
LISVVRNTIIAVLKGVCSRKDIAPVHGSILSEKVGQFSMRIYRVVNAIKPC